VAERRQGQLADLTSSISSSQHHSQSASTRFITIFLHSNPCTSPCLHIATFCAHFALKNIGERKAFMKPVKLENILID
jgi:hypothetical protein